MTVPGLTPEQLAARRTRLTGSTVAAYLGYSPYRSPRAAWRIAMGLDEFTPTEDMVAGNFLEGGIGDLAIQRLEEAGQYGDLPYKAHKPDTVYHPEHPETFCVHPDLIVPGRRFGIQIKNSNTWVAKTYPGKPGMNGDWDNAAVPLVYLMQCQLELECCRAWADEWVLASYFGGSNLRLYRIKRDQRLIRGMLAAGLTFWRDYLNPAGPQREPTDEKWIGPHRREARPAPRLTASELAGAPVPFDDSPVPPLEMGIPFLETRR